MPTFEVRFTFKGHLVAVVYLEAANNTEAAERAEMSVVGHFDEVRVKRT